MHPACQRLHATVSEAGGFAMFVMDDGYAVGPPEVLYPALEQFASDMAEVDLTCQPNNYRVYLPAGVDSDLCPSYMPVESVMIEGDVHHGIVVAGAPVGAPLYVQDKLRIVVDNVVSTTQQSNLRSNTLHHMPCGCCCTTAVWLK